MKHAARAGASTAPELTRLSPPMALALACILFLTLVRFDVAAWFATAATLCVLGLLQKQLRRTALVVLPTTLPLLGFIALIAAAGGEGALRAGAVAGGRVTLLILVVVTVQPSLTASATRRFLVHVNARPSIRIAIPLAISSLESMGSRLEALLDTQRMRGVDVDGSLSNRASAIPALARGLMMGLLLEAEARATALEVRGAEFVNVRGEPFLAAPKSSPIAIYVLATVWLSAFLLSTAAQAAM